MAIKRNSRTKKTYFEFINKVTGLPLNNAEYEVVFTSEGATGDDGDPFDEAWTDELQEAALEQDLLGQTLIQANWVEDAPNQQWLYTLANANIKAIHNAIVQQTRASQIAEPVVFTSGGSTTNGSIIIAVAAEPTVDIDVDIFLKESEALD